MRAVYQQSLTCGQICSEWWMPRDEVKQLYLSGKFVSCCDECTYLFDFDAEDEIMLIDLQAVTRFFETIAQANGVLYALF